MRHKFRVTKYNPALRNEAGHYQRDEWTAFSDIGKAFSDGVLSESEYLRVEQVYLDSVASFFEEARITKLRVLGVQFSAEQCDFRIGEELGIREVQEVARLTLRELMWPLLGLPGKAYLHFGFDYYMYLGLPRATPLSIERAEADGLYVERFRSPYLRDLPQRFSQKPA